jgi:hypothetical protein
VHDKKKENKFFSIEIFIYIPLNVSVRRILKSLISSGQQGHNVYGTGNSDVGVFIGLVDLTLSLLNSKQKKIQSF